MGKTGSQETRQSSCFFPVVLRQVNFREMAHIHIDCVCSVPRLLIRGSHYVGLKGNALLQHSLPNTFCPLLTNYEWFYLFICEATAHFSWLYYGFCIQPVASNIPWHFREEKEYSPNLGQKERPLPWMGSWMALASHAMLLQAVCCRGALTQPPQVRHGWRIRLPRHDLLGEERWPFLSRGEGPWSFFSMGFY